ncbi:hypothetical protein K2173_027691 [Erythroxylum novogranatense]|uniref:Auxin efflux carrier family protein n=1 Tax=Erythroxylum novogranatense TaxID=1862640 RepID=A0AAV8U306_9ROSI|nr:hypothetical protein K2173_027691 [Erythroxylum novogranatense]
MLIVRCSNGVLWLNINLHMKICIACFLRFYVPEQIFKDGALDLFIASSIPVLKVLLITALGSYLALDKVNILGEDARKHINNVVFYVFNPALVASKLATTITLDSLMHLWFMPFNILVTFMIGSLLGWLLILCTRPPSHLRGVIIGCCAAGNLGNMFLIMIPAVCKEKGSPFGSPDICQSYGLGYISLSMAIGAMYLWSYVYNIVRASSAMIADKSRKLHVDISSRESSSSELENCTEPLLSSKEFSPSLEHAHQKALPVTRTESRSEMTILDRLKQRIMTLFANTNWKSLFAPSTIAVVVGFVIGLVPQVRELMIGNNAPLHVIHDSASLIGDGAIPTLTLILGGNLLKGLRGSGVKISLIFGIVVVRYIALPLTGVFIVKGALNLGLIPHDPLYQFILLLQFAVPPAMNIGTITQLLGAGEMECSVVMLWTYALASISLTVWSTFFLWLVT